MEGILPYLINALVGAGGGWLGDMLKKNGLGMIGNLVAGAAGGSILPYALSALGVLGTNTGGGLDIASLVTALLGGGAGSLIGGLFKKA